MRTRLALTMAGAALLCAGPIPARAELPTGPVGRLSGELAITGEDGLRQAAVEATQTYVAETRSGVARIEIKQSGARLAEASARLAADSQDDAGGAVTALILAVTGRSRDGRSRVRLTDVRFAGDAEAFGALADRLIDWWDAKARLTYRAYVSPKPGLTHLGALHLNVWSRDPARAYAVLVLFDAADPTIVAGGFVQAPGGAPLQILGGSLTEITQTPEPGDYRLSMIFPVQVRSANLLLAVHADGTVDVRGVSDNWAFEAGDFIIEGMGTQNFVAPGGVR